MSHPRAKRREGYRIMNRLKSNRVCSFQTLDAVCPKDPLLRVFTITYENLFFFDCTYLLQTQIIMHSLHKRGNTGLPLPTLLAKKFSCCVSYCEERQLAAVPELQNHQPYQPS